MTFTTSFWLLSSYLYASGEFYSFIIVEIDELDLDASGFTTCCVIEMTWVNIRDRYKNFVRQ